MAVDLIALYVHGQLNGLTMRQHGVYLPNDGSINCLFLLSSPSIIYSLLIVDSIYYLFSSICPSHLLAIVSSHCPFHLLSILFLLSIPSIINLFASYCPFHLLSLLFPFHQFSILQRSIHYLRSSHCPFHPLFRPALFPLFIPSVIYSPSIVHSIYYLFIPLLSIPLTVH